jgi:hypothetical protein
MGVWYRMSNTVDQALYEVLSPWADIDPLPLRPISKRLDTLNGKTLGFFDNGKPVAIAMLSEAKRLLLEKYPDLVINWYRHEQRFSYNILQIESQNKTGFLNWLSDVDAVVTAVGD